MNQAEAGGAGIILIIQLALIVLIVVSMWKVFTKAGKPGWASIIPIYNLIVLLQIVGKPLWWIVLLLIPFVNLVVAIILAFKLAETFGKGGGFAVGLILLPIIFYPILAFGDASYTAPANPA
ncbi:MAG TPA: DUF5684 domain-containing protein [Kiritimatiellia bacterium]|nr:DUF5684 domain-containing protein [Kiritimatiellia bacterium]